jgi:membrane protease YdiL (CAAX protease family)
LSAIVLSSGAGFYEELAFRVILFGLGAWLVHKLFKATGPKIVGEIVWALVAASSFSAVHYFGSLGDDFTLSSFLFRMVCGLVLTAVYRFRGFATAVWTHALYDIGVMAF